MSASSERDKDVLLMLFAVQCTLLVYAMPAWTWPLLLFPALLTVQVMRAEYHRRLEELPERREVDP
ncbi:hypothetical protein [Natrarchaeobius oligotrophus]|uniref:Uncharacterized protein n=1 Tax=Natrarchaeobius chitinivorans TaxID=1679083 RepID=A0A3N6N2F2_NATCH|nr:hypothetical protein [Natrarchaeobius chitinivorans]RQH03032.1 hypothetical protein EA472_00045 [Natrarchaeobius chitinivorans]